MKDILAKEVMSSPVISVDRHTHLSEVVKILERHNISGVPVVDEKEKILGIISERDILKYTHFVVGQPIRDICQLLEENDEVARAGSDRGVDLIEAVASNTAEVVMTNEIITAKEESPVLEIVILMNKYGINRVPIVDEGKKLKGMVTRANILQMLEQWAENN